MAEKRRFLDVWITQSNTVYREVPFSVVTDWVQQGRLLADDKLRPSGTEKWLLVGAVSAFKPYLPRMEPMRTEDRAEALEPVETEVAWKRSRGEEDDDVDMIPLIDVSLVLLIFFMIISSVGGPGSFIPTPKAEHKLLMIKENMLWVGMSGTNKDNVQYSLGQGDKAPAQEDQHLNAHDLLARLDARLQAGGRDIRIRATPQLPFEVVKELVQQLEARRGNGVRTLYAEVSEKDNK